MLQSEHMYHVFSYRHLLITQRISQILDTTLWLFKVAIENCPFIDGLPGFSWVYLLKMMIFHGYVK